MRVVLAIIALSFVISVFIGCGGGTAPTPEGEWFYVTTADGLASNKVYDIWVGPDAVYYATEKGLSVSRDDGSWKTYNASSGLPADACYAVADENLKYTWVGTSAGAARITRAGVMTVYDTGDGLPDPRVNCVAWDGLHVWFGTDAGLARFDDPGFTVFTTADGLPADEVRDIFPVEVNDIWVATTGGAARYETGDFTIYNSTTIGLGNDTVNSVVCKGGTVWFGTEYGLYRYESAALTPFYASNSNLAGDTINDVAYSAWGELWVATVNGVSRLNGSDFETFRAPDGPRDNYVLRAARDYSAGPVYDYVWFGTLSAGVARYGMPGQ
jgi:ligand-binding sensor domain-containing protein